MSQKPSKSKANSHHQRNTNKKSNDRSKLITRVILGGVILATFIVFFPMLKNQFTSWDDTEYITQNTRIWKLNGENLKFIFTQPMAGNYHPFTMLSLGLNYAFSKLNPFSYFLTNLLLHLINTVLVFWFVMLLTKKNTNIALFCAIIFAIHPMHVESVAWATERKDVLYTFFYLPALIAWIFYTDTRKPIYYCIAFLLSACSMFSKPAAIILPAVFIAVEYYRAENFEIKSVLNKIPFYILAAFFMYMTLIAQATDNAVIGDFKNYTAIQRILFAGYGFLIYLFKFFVPIHLATFHPYPKSIGVMEYCAPLIIAAMLTAAYYLKTYRKLLLFGLMFYFINLVLVLQFFSIGSALYAERYTYVPYIALSFVIGVILFEKLKVNAKTAWIALGAGSLLLAVGANARVGVWHDNETLWTDMIEKYPDLDRGYYDRGNFYSSKNETEKAIADFSMAIKVGTDYRTYTNRGVAYLKLLKYAEALKDFDDAIRINPTQDEAFLGRAHVNFDLKKYDQALSDASEAIKFKPSYDAYFFRGLVFKTMQKYDEAIADYNMAASKSNDVIVYTNRGNVYFQIQKYDEAIADYNKVLSVNASDANALANRGAAFFQLNHFDEAIRDISQSLKIEPNSARNYSNLALIYEKKGDKALALDNATKAMKLGAAFPPEFLAKLKK